jgi:8-oxo-dGTP pyrophosphatase MutT (NUDIX family)
VSLHDDAVAQLTRWSPPTAEQASLQASYLQHLAAHPDGLSRDCLPSHLTASVLVVSDRGDAVLLNLHGKYGIWVQFGGHCEPGDATLAEAALREAIEESGLARLELLGPEPVQLSRHEVRCGPVQPAYHLDVRYLAVAPADAVPVTSPESVDVRWFAADALPDLEPELRELVALATTRQTRTT